MKNDIFKSVPVMERLAMFAHGPHFCNQTSSATFAEIAELLSYYQINQNSMILDLGCGSGTFSIQIAKKYQCRVYGVDISSELIKEAKEKSKTYPFMHLREFHVSDFSYLPELHNIHFDFLLAIGSLYWNTNLGETLRLWKNKLAKQGILIIFLNMKYGNLTDKDLENIGSTIFIDANNMDSLLKENDLRIIQENDQTSTYISWLCKWCEGMEALKSDIYLELGEEAGQKMITRFFAYLDLAKRNTVRRKVLVAGRGEK